jgi:hypothetical protein
MTGTDARRTMPTTPETIEKRQLTREEAELLQLWRASSPHFRKVALALLQLLRGKTLQGEPLTDTQRAEALALVLPELEKCRADGFPAEDAQSLLSKITTGGKS